MNNKIVLISILLVIISCNTDHTNKDIDLTFLNTHSLDIENGKNIFNRSCMTCHLYGTGGATLLTDKNAWEQLFREKEMKTIFLTFLMHLVRMFHEKIERKNCKFSQGSW